jgi:hypothetical protein
LDLTGVSTDEKLRWLRLDRRDDSLALDDDAAVATDAPHDDEATDEAEDGGEAPAGAAAALPRRRERPAGCGGSGPGGWSGACRTNPGMPPLSALVLPLP